MPGSSSSTITLWTQNLAGLATPPDTWLQLLNTEERAQCQRFLRQQDRLAYAAAHALLYRALGLALQLPPAALTIAHDPMGKPFLAAPADCGCFFSLSHTEGMAAIAFSSRLKIGVDIEAMDRNKLPDDDFSAYGCSAEESARLTACAEPDKCRIFFEGWTAREAIAKADGRGLSLPFERIRIDRSRKLATIAAEGKCPASQWRLWHQQASPHHCLALAWPEENGNSLRTVISGSGFQPDTDFDQVEAYTFLID